MSFSLLRALKNPWKMVQQFARHVMCTRQPSGVRTASHNRSGVLTVLCGTTQTTCYIGLRYVNIDLLLQWYILTKSVLEWKSIRQNLVAYPRLRGSVRTYVVHHVPILRVLLDKSLCAAPQEYSSTISTSASAWMTLMSPQLSGANSCRLAGSLLQ